MTLKLFGLNSPWTSNFPILHFNDLIERHSLKSSIWPTKKLSFRFSWKVHQKTPENIPNRYNLFIEFSESSLIVLQKPLVPKRFVHTENAFFGVQDWNLQIRSSRHSSAFDGIDWDSIRPKCKTNEL